MLTVKMESICAACLTAGRRLAALKIPANTIKIWFGMNIADLVCWECQATLFKFVNFRDRVLAAQDTLLQCHANIKSLSQLSYAYKDTYDEIMVQGMKTEVFECPIEHVDKDSDDDVSQDVKLEKVGESSWENDIKCTPANDYYNTVVPPEQSLIKFNVEEVKKKAKKQSNSYYKIKYLNMEEVEKIRREDLAAKRYVTSLFKCETCILGYGIKTIWQSHNTRLHSEESGSHICSLCQQRFKTEEILNNHYKAHFRCYVCLHCDFAHPRFNVIQVHYSKKHKDGFQCDKCPTESVFRTRGKLTYHQKTMHRELPICPVPDCAKTFKTDYSLKNHMLQHNGGTPRLECTICHKLVKGELNMRAHMKTHTDPPPPPPTEFPYCITCDRQFPCRIQYDRHMKYSAPHRKPDVLKFQCSHCEKKYIKKDYMEDHVRSTHLNRRDFICDVCHKTFNTVRLLTRHRSRHDGPREKVRDKVCEQCGKAFMMKKTLEEHMNSHTGARPFECQVCGDRFSYSSALFNHNRLKHENFKRKRKT